MSQYWQEILSDKPQTADEFMAAVLRVKPDLDEFDIVCWQRSTRDWTTDVFEFIWFKLKIMKGQTQWIQKTEAMWPNIERILAQAQARAEAPLSILLQKLLL